MDPFTMILSAASAMGGILGNQRKYIDPNFLKTHFGAQAVNQETMDLFNQIINSPYGQKLMTSAAEQGQQFQTATSQAAARSGLGPGSGATSGADIFATGAASGAGASFKRAVQSNVYSEAMPIAQRMVNERMQAYLQDREMGGTQDNAGRTWQAIGNAAGVAGSLYRPTPKTDITPQDTGGQGGTGPTQGVTGPGMPDIPVFNSLTSANADQGQPRWSRLAAMGRGFGRSRFSPEGMNVQPAQAYGQGGNT